jgi:hypothetical protein
VRINIGIGSLSYILTCPLPTTIKEPFPDSRSEEHRSWLDLSRSEVTRALGFNFFAPWLIVQVSMIPSYRTPKLSKSA